MSPEMKSKIPSWLSIAIAFRCAITIFRNISTSE